MVTPGRIVSSTEMTDPRISTGIISSANKPFASAYPGLTVNKMIFLDKVRYKYLAGSGMRNQGILVLLSARNLVCLCDQFSSPTHRLEAGNLSESKEVRV